LPVPVIELLVDGCRVRSALIADTTEGGFTPTLLTPMHLGRSPRRHTKGSGPRADHLASRGLVADRRGRVDLEQHAGLAPRSLTTQDIDRRESRAASVILKL